MKSFYYSLALSVVFILGALPMGCNSTNPSSTAPVTVVSGYPSPTPTAPPFILWQNGTAGCFQNNCVVGQVVVAPGGATTQVTGNNLELDNSSASNCYAGLGMTILNNTIDVTGYLNGHLQMDVKLGQAASAYSVIYVDVYGPAYYLNLSDLSTSSFTHVSIPTNLNLATNPTVYGNPLININLGCPSGPVYFPNPGPLLYINNVEWTAD